MTSYADYLKRLHKEANHAYEIAEKARAKGFDGLGPRHGLAF